jgi:hypothetical protein
MKTPDTIILLHSMDVVRSPMTLTKRMHSLGGLGDESGERTPRGIRSVGQMKMCGCEEGHLDGDVWHQGAHNLLSL